MASSKDAVIMGTNSYSIVSKRSVEHLYLAGDPQFLAEFVPLVKRRSPLINRGYWLRMKAVEDAVKAFVDEPSSRTDFKHDATAYSSAEHDSKNKRKLVVNLGCGEDTLPFRLLEKFGHNRSKGSEQNQVLFIDVDYADLMEAKAERIMTSPLLRNILGIREPETPQGHPSLLLQTSDYAAIGADLNDLESVTRQLTAAINEYCGVTVEDFSGQILFIAEVSITYMPTHAADALIGWAANLSSFAESTFVLLEQILPAGRDHPFVKTMLSHFEKTAPLQSVIDYPALNDQRQRFTAAGWRSITPRTLWDVWEEVDAAIRQEVEMIEPFDEWEEFALFCSHYVFLIARNNCLHKEAARSLQDVHHAGDATRRSIGGAESKTKLSSNCLLSDERRFGALFALGDQGMPSSEVLHAGGYDADNRRSKEAHVIESALNAQGTRIKDPLDVPVLQEPSSLEQMGTLDCSPFVLRKQDLGSCTSHWSPTYLSNAVGPERKVTIHESAVQALDFTSKNFTYASVPFGDLVSRAVSGKHVYLRALADGREASTKPASLARDFPTVAADFKLPQELLDVIGEDSVHSSVLRIAGNIDMWLHYDVMANILCQIRGHKRIVLFPPDNVLKLGFIHGSTTSSVDMFGPSGLLAQQRDTCTITGHSGVSQHEAMKPDDEMSGASLPAALSCFTITSSSTKGSSHILVGGRRSPRQASSACWILDRQHDDIVAQARWTPIASLEPGRFRHCATVVCAGSYHGVLVFGGKTSQGALLDSWNLYVHRTSNDWIAPTVKSKSIPEARFGAAMCTISNKDDCSRGWLMGGLGRNHRHLNDLWEWRITSDPLDPLNVELTFINRTTQVGGGLRVDIWSRFGATLTPLNESGGALLIGGIGPAGVIQPDDEVLHISRNLQVSSMHIDAWAGNQPLLVGHSVLNVNGKIIVAGGGAVCFSFGSYWNKVTTVLDAASTEGVVEARPQRLDSDHVQPREIVLGPGDCLSIPACWPHATAPGSSELDRNTEDGHMNVAVNVFFRSLEKGYAAGRDVYGNRDLDCYQNGRRDVQKIRELLKDLDATTRYKASAILSRIVQGAMEQPEQSMRGSKEAMRIKKSVQTLPDQLRRFYLLRLAAEIEDTGRDNPRE